MEIKQSTFGEIIDSEREMVLRGADRFGDFFVNAAEFNDLLSKFIGPVNLDRNIFTAFLSQVRKHHTLALFSAVRLHHVQTMMNLRQTLEAGSCAAYALANTSLNDFADTEENGLLDASQELATKRYAWLSQNYPQGSKKIQAMKKTINVSCAHANIVYAHNNFSVDIQKRIFVTPFFDFEDDFHVQTDLWCIAGVAMSLMDLFFGINKDYGAIKFADDFVARMRLLEEKHAVLRSMMISSERFQRITAELSKGT